MSGPLRTPRGIFIAGTDTSVGKTIGTAVVASACTAHGVNTGIMKPIETGVRVGEGALSDTGWLRTVTGVHDPADLVTPYRFQIPAAPLVAATQAGRSIDPRNIIEAFRALSALHDCLVVEGIGGVLVPITPDLSLADLVKLMGLPVLVVARVSLGSINHTLLTLECLRSRGVPVLGVIFNNPSRPPADADLTETVPTILRLSGVRAFGELPYCEGLPATWTQHRDTLVARLDVQGLLEALGLRGLA